MSPLALPAVVLVLVLAMMIAEALRSRRNEARLRARGAIEPSDDVYPLMLWAYPLCFVVMALEAFGAGPPSTGVILSGAVGMALSKALKYWAIGSLGDRWTFRVLILPEPLVTAGPYRWLRHPNYVAVIGELMSMALLMGARFTGPVAVVLFSLLIWRRIRVEESALRHFTCS